MLGSVVSMICMPMWAANGEALGRGDVLWVRRNTTRLMRFSVFFTAFAAIAATVIGPPVLRLWLGDEFEVSRWLLFGIGASFVLTAGASPYFMVINAAGLVATQVKTFLVFTPVAVVAKIGLAMWLGSVGVPIANAVCYGTIVLPVAVVLARKVLRENPVAGRMNP
jgi:O-antigen/teichoic acid export membrane protein